MRKFFALALAVAMVFSMAAVSFAEAIDPNSVIVLSDFHKYDGDDNMLKDAQAQYGKSYYAMIFEGAWNYNETAGTAAFEYHPITKYDRVEKLKVKAEFEMGEDLVESVSIVKKAFDADGVMEAGNPDYVVAVASDVNAANKWINGDTTNTIDDGKYYKIGTTGDAITYTGANLKNNVIAASSYVAGDNGVINKFDLFKIDDLQDSGAGSSADPYIVAMATLGTYAGISDIDDALAMDDINDVTPAVDREVKTNNFLSLAKATKTSSGWEYAADAATATIDAPTGSYYYFVEVKTKSDRVVGDADIIGTFEFNRKGKDEIAKIDDCEVDFAFNLWYEKNYLDNADNLLVDGDTVELKWDDLYVLKFENDDEVEFEFGKNDLNEGVFTVDVSGQGKMVMDFNTKANEVIAEANEGVKMFFVSFNGAKFNRTGVFEYEMEDLVAAYQIVDDKLVEINGLEIDGETATFSTRTLGNYVFANAELVDAVVEAPVVEAPAAVTNPSTGF